MDRRDFLKLAGMASMASIVGMNLHLAPETAFASAAYREEAIQAGWLNDPSVVRYFVRDNVNPYLSQVNAEIRGTGKGQIALLWPFLEQVMGQPLIPHDQEIGDCFIADTKVTMADGSQKNIQDVVVGDSVISHKGRVQPVLRTIKKPYTGDLITINCTGFASDITSTPDHRFLTHNAAWKCIDNLDTDVIVPTLTLPVHETVYDLAQYMQSECIIDSDTLRRYPNSQTQVSRFIKLDADLAWLLGIYLAEGGIDGIDSQRITFSLHRKETDLAKRIDGLFNTIFGVTTTTIHCPSKPNVLLVRCSNTIVAKFFKQLVPGNVYSKVMPVALGCAALEIKMSCLQGWLDGDGCLQYKKRKNSPYWMLRCTGRTSSKQLAQGMFQLMAACNLTPRLSVQYQLDRAPAYSLTVYGSQVEDLYPQVCSEGRHVQVITARRNRVDCGLAFKIKTKQTTIIKNGTVYCLEVEHDNSFIANGYAVHNCVSHVYGLGVDILTALQILKRKSPQRWVAEAATEIIYGGGRIEIGTNRYNKHWRGDGMTGTVAAEFVKSYGILLRQKYLDRWDFTTYSGDVARKLGASGVPDPLEPLCRVHPIGCVTLVRSWEEARDCLYNGYPIALASSQGFNTRGGRDKDGFLSPSRNPWMHCMLLAGMDDTVDRPGGLFINSWGSTWVKGPKRHNQPDGSFWADASVIDRICKQGDSIAMSCYAGYPRQEYNLW